MGVKWIIPDQTTSLTTSGLSPFFKHLPRMYDRLGELVGEALTSSVSWQCKLELLDRMSDVLDRTMIEASSPPAHGVTHLRLPVDGARL